MARSLPADLEAHLPDLRGEKKMATRKASGKILAALAPAIPELVGGSADLTESNNTALPTEQSFTRECPGRYVHFGVREHAMGAILNGMSLHGGLRAFGATFLIFSDYMRPAIRLAALIGLPVVYVLTHDSILLGEDGPTHQPVSQLASLRSIPGLVTLRPADARETVAAWRVALERRAGPTALALTRQKLPVLAATAERAEAGVERGAYVLWESVPGASPELLLLATGSEVALALAAGQSLGQRGRAVRVVSMPSWELFGRQEEAYRRSVLPPGVRRRLAVEAGTPLGWHRWVGLEGEVLAMERFGASGAGEALAERFGFTAEAVAARAAAYLERAL
jgi:transketolase